MKKKINVVSGHQPAYLPWLGLIHKASLCDVFIYMDDVQFLNRDFNHRNRIKTSFDKVSWLTVPVDLKKSSSNLIKDILIVKEKVKIERTWQTKHWKAIQASYGKTKYFKQYSPFFEWVYLENQWTMLSDLNIVLLRQMFDWFGISPQLVIGSKENFKGKKSDLVLNHGLQFKADVIVTGKMGKEYIRIDDFKANNMNVVFQNYKHPEYGQRFGDFVPHLSCIDLLFNMGPQSKEICFNNNITRSDL